MNAPAQDSSHLRHHTLAADLAIVGGGMAGVCAALAAARQGAKVVLVQDRSVLGGNASSEVKMHIVGADCHGQRPGLRESGLIEELRLDDAVGNSYRCYSQWDLLLYEKVKAEPNITLLLDTTCIGCETEGGAIRTIRALRNPTEDVFEIRAPFFADCSGDSRLALEAGADFHVGRESREEFNESLAQKVADRQTLGSSILLTGRRHDAPQPFRAPAWVRKFTKDDLNYRPIHSFEYGYWWFEWGGQLDTIHDNEIIRHELLRIALGIWDHVKNSGLYPESAPWALDWVGAVPGKRESRRLLGPHVLVQDDLTEGRLFPDAVAYGGWAIDLHPPSGIDARDEPPFVPTHLDRVYTIPLRALYSRNVPNLFFAGRNISATHVAFASTRVMATCAIEGQAIGTAAALAARRGIAIAALLELDRMRELQQQLLKDDAFIPAVRGEDPRDLARGARVTVSSEQPDHEGALVLDGITRDLIGKCGPWADQRPHHWRSSGLPAWIELELPAPVEIGEIHLTFDSGFSRELILTPSDHITKHTVRGPQPETVRAYRVHAGGSVVIEETDNHQRKRVHRLREPVTTTSLRVEILATHGVPDAHLFEIRAYPGGA
ncbi:MAG: FAD-dependent oxidoreductase [Verrucomicrobiota bacterium]